MEWTTADWSRGSGSFIIDGRPSRSGWKKSRMKWMNGLIKENMKNKDTYRKIIDTCKGFRNKELEYTDSQTEIEWRLDYEEFMQTEKYKINVIRRPKWIKKKHILESSQLSRSIIFNVRTIYIL